MIEDRLRASVRSDAINGNSQERSICGRQMIDAATEIERLRQEIIRLQRLIEEKG